MNQFEKFSLGNSKSSLSQLKSSKSHNEKIKNNFENKISSDEKKNILGNNSLNNSSLGIPNETIISNERDLKDLYINNWLLCCFWCTTKKKNMNWILFEESSKIITETLDIINIFNNLYSVEIIRKKLGIEVNGKEMSDNCKNSLQLFNNNNNFKNNN